MKMFWLICLSAVIVPCFAHANDVSKKQYSLFNPVPRELMREISTDRPDKTESPYTVDAGHYQVETSLLDYSYNRSNDDRTDTYSVLPSNFKVGLLNNADLQFVFNPYIARHSAIEKSKQGFGDIQTRLKINIWGNDGGGTAFALMPYIKFPANGAHLENNDVEGGLILPLAIDLGGQWGLGLMTQFDAIKDEEGGNYHPEFINSVTVSRPLWGELSGYLEFFSKVIGQEKSEWEGTVDAGLTYALNPDVQMDIGVNTGVTNVADDFNPFIGISARY